MTDEQAPDPGTRESERQGEVEREVDPRVDREDTDDAGRPDTNPWLKEGADAPDAADIEDPGEQL